MFRRTLHLIDYNFFSTEGSMAFQLGSSNDGDQEDGDLSEINIIPLVDVMLVLLIIFMVAAPLSIGGINVNLPHSKAKGGSMSEDRIVLSINKEGEYFVEKMKVPAAQLEERMRAIFEFRDNKELYIRADTGVIYGRVVDAMSAARVAGVGRMSMLTQPSKATGH